MKQSARREQYKQVGEKSQLEAVPFLFVWNSSGEIPLHNWAIRFQ